MAELPFQIVFAVYSGMTQLDFTAPHQFLSRVPRAEVTVASLAGGDVTSEGLTFAKTQRLADVATCDLICVPGGAAATEIALDERFVEEVRRLGLGAKYVTSVCTGSLIIGAAGLLAGRRATCHWASRHLLPLFGAVPVDERVVRDGNVITGGGVTAGVDFALSMLAELGGAELAQAVQLEYEYAPQPPFHAGSPHTAPAEIVAAYRERSAGLTERRDVQARTAAARLAMPQA